MNGCFSRRFTLIATLALMFLTRGAWATFHLMQIEQIIGGVNGDTAAQAIQLRMRTIDQNFTSLSRVKAYDANGQNPVLLIDFTSDVVNAAGGDRILIYTPRFANYVPITLQADYIMAPIPDTYLAAGKITFEDDTNQILWSVAFGGASYTGTNTGTTDNDADGNFGAPYANGLPTSNNQALQFSGNSAALSSTNAADYALSGSPAIFTNNARASAALTTFTTPSVTASSNSPVCAGNTLQLTATSISGATYSWTGPSGFTSTQQNPQISNVSANAAGMYSVSASVGGAPTNTSNVTVTVNPATPSPTASSNSPICAGTTLQLFATTVSGATYSWTGPNGFTSSQQNPTISNATVNHSGTYMVTANIPPCTSAVASVSVTVNAIPAAPTAANDGPVCEGGSLNLSASTVANAAYSWTGPNGFSSSQQNPSLTNVTAAQSGIYSVTVTVNGCTSLTATTNATVNSIPTAPVAGNNGPVNEGSLLLLTATAIQNASYSWTGPNGFTASVENPAISKATVANAGTYTVVATVNGCTSLSASTTVVVNAIVPKFTSGPTATPNPATAGTPVQFIAAASGQGTLTTTWDFGDGSNAIGSSVTHLFKNAGDYVVNATVTDARNYSTSGTINLSVTPKMTGNGQVDTDGDGFSDQLEQLLNSSPTDYASTPLGGAAIAQAQPLSLMKMGIKLNFAKPNSDGLSAAGLLTVPDAFVVENQPVVIDIGGVVRSFVLNAKGASAAKQPDLFKLGIKLTNKQVLSQSAKWSLKMSKGSFAAALVSYGLTSTDEKSKPVKIPVTIIFNSNSFETLRDQFYSAKAGKTGAAKD